MIRFPSLKGIISMSYGEIIGLGFSSIFWLWLAREISPEDYGEIHFFIGIVSMVGYIVTLGTSETITVFTAKKIPLQSTLFLISLITGGIGCIVLSIIFNRIDISILLFGYIINFLVIGELLGNQKFNTYSKFILLQKILTLTLGVSFYLIFKEEGIIFAIAITYLPLLSKFYQIFKREKVDFTLLRQKFEFIITNYSMKVTGGISGHIDAVIIAPILGMVVFGNYSLSLVIINMMMMGPNLIFKYLLPKESIGEKNKGVKKWSIILISIIAISAIFVLPQIIPVIFPKFVEVLNIIQIMSISIIPRSIAGIYEAKFLGMEKSRYVLNGYLIHLAIMIVGMIGLGLLFGIVGMAIAFLLSNVAKAGYFICQNLQIKKTEKSGKN
jgi:O-antigen/teichoic acid export membrane protein